MIRIMSLLVFTGARRSNVLAMRWDHHLESYGVFSDQEQGISNHHSPRPLNCQKIRRKGPWVRARRGNHRLSKETLVQALEDAEVKISAFTSPDTGGL